MSMKKPPVRTPTWATVAVVLLIPLVYVIVLGSNSEPARRAVELLRAVAEVVHSVPVAYSVPTDR